MDDVLGKPREWVALRFFSRIVPEPNSGCWLWDGFCTHQGYGRMSVGRRSIGAHRVSYALHRGNPGSAHVCHSCDVPPCVNPDHLWLGTNKQNMVDASAKGRIAHGVRSATAKLRECDVVEMRRMRAAGATYRGIAKAFGVVHGTARHACVGKFWDHVGEPPSPTVQPYRKLTPELTALIASRFSTISGMAAALDLSQTTVKKALRIAKTRQVNDDE